MSKITYTLNEIARNAHDFDQFCEDFGYDACTVKERGGHEVEITLSVKRAKQYGLLDTED